MHDGIRASRTQPGLHVLNSGLIISVAVCQTTRKASPFSLTTLHSDAVIEAPDVTRRMI